jgi:hypothetical protein
MKVWEVMGEEETTANKWDGKIGREDIKYLHDKFTH